MMAPQRGQARFSECFMLVVSLYFINQKECLVGVWPNWLRQQTHNLSISGSNPDIPTKHL